VIVGIGNKTVRTPDDIEQGVADARESGRETVLLLVSGDQGQHYVAWKVAKGHCARRRRNGGGLSRQRWKFALPYRCRFAPGRV
jgi:hypothetical protein